MLGEAAMGGNGRAPETAVLTYDRLGEAASARLTKAGEGHQGSLVLLGELAEGGPQASVERAVEPGNGVFEERSQGLWSHYIRGCGSQGSFQAQNLSSSPVRSSSSKSLGESSFAIPLAPCPSEPASPFTCESSVVAGVSSLDSVGGVLRKKN